MPRKPRNGVVDAVEAVLAAVEAAPADVALVATARKLGGLLDDPTISATAAAAVARELRQTLAALDPPATDAWNDALAGIGGPE